jgi:hypothetical protein
MQARRHGRGRYGHGHSTFSRAMATNAYGHITFHVQVILCATLRDALGFTVGLYEVGMSPHT